jgi:hypothetical protein
VTHGTGAGATGSAGAGGQAYDSIDVEPPTVTLTVALGNTATQTYQVFGVKGGQKTDITATCTLSLDPTFGSAQGAVVTVQPHGGTTPVLAACGGQSGTSQLTVNLTGTVLTGMKTPMNAPTIFGAATAGSDPTRAPGVEYPLDHAVAPRNIPPIEIQWKPAGNDLFHVSLTSTNATIDVYTSDLQAALSAGDWDAVAGTVAGGAVSIVVEGLLQAAPATKYAGAGVSLSVSHDTIDKTAIYYWASSAGDLMTQTFGETTAPTQVKNDCTSCHSVSRAGSRIGYSRCVAMDCGQIFVGFMRYDTKTMAWKDTVDANQKAINGSFTTFAPLGNPFQTDAQSVAIVTKAGGTLSLYDPDTGAAIPSNLDTVSTHGPGAPRSALMPDWSADGNTVVFASTPHAGQWIDLNDGAIATMSYKYTGAQHVFGEPQFLFSQPIMLAGGSYTNFFFPSFSTDGALIVFNAARAQWRDLSVAAAAGQRLLLADAKGAWVTDLTALDGGSGDLDITWPHWAPGNTTDYYWIVFSSERDYGHEVTAANTAPACVQNGVKQCKQLWIGAIDKKKLGGAMPADPSAPPVWLPGQDIKADNISPYWTVPVTQIPQ